MGRDSLSSPFPVSFPNYDSEDNVLLSSLWLLWVSSWFCKTIFLNRRRSRTTLLSSLKKDLTAAASIIFRRENLFGTKDEISNSIIPARPDSVVLDEARVDLVLPDDVWAEILCRLRPSNMVKCNSVSKSWNRLISDVCIPKITSPLYGLFIPTRLSYHRKGSRTVRSWDFACLDGTGRPNNGKAFVRFAFCILPIFPSYKHFIDSSNGLLLFWFGRGTQFFVCNPSTDQLIGLPRAPILDIPCSANFTFDPHFNVVCPLKKPFRMLIYSSVTNEWVIHSQLCLEDSVLAGHWRSRAVLADGALYRLSTSGHILEFHCKPVSVRAIELPKIVEREMPIGCIGVSKGRFHYAWNDRNAHQLLVWMLDVNQWILKYTISLLNLAKDPIPGIFHDSLSLSVYAFHPTSDVLFVGHEVGIFRYHPGSKELDCIYRVRSNKSISGGQLQIYPFSRNFPTFGDFNRSSKKKPAREKLIYWH